MIYAKDLKLEDRGFFAGTKKIGGVVRQTLTIALAGGLDDAALAAVKEGPLAVLELVLAREDPKEDVAVLEAQVAQLQAALNEARSAQESAEGALQAAQDAQNAEPEAQGTDVGSDGL